MAGYGNRVSAEPNPSDHEPSHAETHLSPNNSHSYGSGTTAGAGFGNKSTPSTEDAAENSEFRFGSYQDSDPYSNATRHGSGTVGGAGYGNKTGAFKPKNGGYT